MKYNEVNDFNVVNVHWKPNFCNFYNIFGYWEERRIYWFYNNIFFLCVSVLVEIMIWFPTLRMVCDRKLVLLGSFEMSNLKLPVFFKIVGKQ